MATPDNFGPYQPFCARYSTSRTLVSTFVWNMLPTGQQL
jgi:hypothetical protein